MTSPRNVWEDLMNQYRSDNRRLQREIKEKIKEIENETRLFQLQLEESSLDLAVEEVKEVRETAWKLANLSSDYERLTMRYQTNVLTITELEKEEE